MTEDNALTESIPIIYADYQTTGEKGLLTAVKAIGEKIGILDSAQLAKNLSVICERLATVFRAAQDATSGFEIDQFEVALDLTASGEVRLVGAISSDIRGGVKVIFRRPRSWHEQ